MTNNWHDITELEISGEDQADFIERLQILANAVHGNLLYATEDETLTAYMIEFPKD